MKSVTRIAGGGFAVDFERQGDRYAHKILRVDGTTERMLLTSLEGGADESWPPSPPLQQLHVEERPGGLVIAFLVGMAGSSHWSLSCSLDAESRRIEFDVAVRLKTVPGWLGSRYRFAPGVAADQAGALVAESISMPLTTSAESLVADDSISFRPLGPLASVPTTARWQFGWSWL